MRKSLIAAGAAVLALGGGGVAYAAVAPTSTVTASVKPSKAGTPKKPRAVQLVLHVKNNLTSQTAAQLKIVAPKQLTLSTKGFKLCNATKLANGTPKVCPKGSQIGPVGAAHAMSGVNGSSPQPATFKVTPFATGKRSLGFFLELGTLRGLAVGTISGHTLTVKIPPTPAQQYPPGSYNALLDLTANLWVKGGKGVAHLTGCPTSKQLKFTNTIKFVPNPGNPPVPTSTASGVARCTK